MTTVMTIAGAMVVGINPDRNIDPHTFCGIGVRFRINPGQKRPDTILKTIIL